MNDMSLVWTAVLVLSIIGAICVIVLIIASKYMSVPVDETAVKIRECLAGANCGACGYAGCDGYADALAKGEITETTLCVPGGAEAAKGIAAVLGVEAGEVVAKKAFVKCNGTCNKANKKYEYEGIQTCYAAKILFSGEWACTSGCLGYGDCERACPSGAIHVDNGVAKVNPFKCTGCGICANQCPQKVIAIRTENDHTIVRCNSKVPAKAKRAACTAGCISCKACERACPNGAIVVTDNLAQIDYSKCTSCGACKDACKFGVIESL